MYLNTSSFVWKKVEAFLSEAKWNQYQDEDDLKNQFRYRSFNIGFLFRLDVGENRPSRVTTISNQSEKRVICKYYERGEFRK